MNNSFDFFEKIFCINLEERVDRWDKCQQKFTALGILDKVERFRAVQISTTDHFQAKMAGRAGCALSHASILDIAIKENLSNYLVLEDDFDLSPTSEECSSILSSSTVELPKDWDLFYLGGNLNRDYGVFPLEKYSENLFRLRSCHTTHSFAVNSSFYSEFKKQLPTAGNVIEWLNTHQAIDVHLSKEILPHNNAFIPTTMLFVQQADFSDIEDNYYDYVSWMENNFNNFKTSLLP